VRERESNNCSSEGALEGETLDLRTSEGEKVRAEGVRVINS